MALASRRTMRAAGSRGRGVRLISANPAAAVLVVLIVASALASPRFLSGANLLTMAVQSAIPLVFALGETFIILTGCIDLSMPGIAAVSAVVMALLVQNGTNGNKYGYLGLAIALTAATALGFANGILNTAFRIPSFMATLGVSTAAVGLATLMYQGIPVVVSDSGVLALSAGHVIGIPASIIIAVIVFVALLIVERNTLFGRHVYAVGGGEHIARMSGVRVARIKVLTFTLAGFLFGLAGIMLASQLGSATSTLGGASLFPAITAVVLGGTALTGGVGGCTRTVIGVLVLTVVGNIMILLGINPFTQIIVQGVLLVSAVLFTTDRSRLAIIK